MQCLLTFIEKETHNLKISFIYIIQKNCFFLKKGACVFWAPVFFLSFLAGKLRHFKWMLLTEFQKPWRMRIFPSFLAGKINKIKRVLPRK